MTSIEVSQLDGRHRVRTREGLLRAQRLHGPSDRCRLALLATTGLLLGGDTVDIRVVVGPEAFLDLSDVAGTVAYHGRGQPAGWSMTVVVAAGGRLRYRGEPFVVAEGADVTRELRLELAASARVLVRDTVVLGRTGECSGRLLARTRVDRDGRALLLEELAIDPVTAGRPGMLGPHRVIDSVLVVGEPSPDVGPPAQRFELLDPDASLTRFLGTSLAPSPLHSI